MASNAEPTGPGGVPAAAGARFSRSLLQQLQDGAAEEQRGKQPLRDAGGAGGSRLHPQEEGEKPHDEDRLRVVTPLPRPREKWSQIPLRFSGVLQWSPYFLK